MLPKRVRPGQRIDAEDMNRIRAGLKAVRYMDSTEGIETAAGPGGLSVSLAHKMKGAIWCQIVDTGPDGESNYTDERYWVRSIVPVNTSGDAESKLELDKQDIIDISGEARVSGSSSAIMYGFWVTATNLAEWLGQGHNLPADTPVLVYPIFDSRSTNNLHWVFNSGGGGGGSVPAIRPGIITDATELTGYAADRHTYMGVYIDVPHIWPGGTEWLTPSWNQAEQRIDWVDIEIEDLRGSDDNVHYKLLIKCTENTYDDGDVVDVIHEWKVISNTEAGEPEIWAFVPIGLRAPEPIEHVVAV